MTRRTSRGDTEPELVDRARGGDLQAFEDLTRMHVRTVLRYAASMVVDRAGVEDVAQEVMLVAWRRRADLDPARSLLPWLLVTTRNVALAANRRHVRHEASDLDAVDHLRQWERGHEAREAAGELAALRDALDGLPEADRDLVRLCFVEGLSYDEASRALGLTPPAARKRVQRLRARLRDLRAAATDTLHENTETGR
jgi:RNA polymerase sigma factor (sigma-70 family)